MPTIADLLVEQGRVLADVRRRKGERAGAIVTSLGDIPAAIIDDRERQRERAIAERRQSEADQRAADENRRQNEEAARQQQAFDLAKAAPEQKRQAVLGWMKQHAADLKPEEAQQMQSILELPGGADHLVEHLTKAPAPYNLIEHDPTKDLVDPRTGKVVTPGTQKPDKITYGQPQPVIVGGRRILARSGSDGALYDMQGQKIQDAQPDVPPSHETEPLVAIVGPDGQSVLVPRSQAVGKRPANAREQGRPVISGDANRIADFDTGLGDLGVLRTVISGNQATGTAAKIGTKIPNWATEITGWGADAKSKNAVIMRVKQVIGKTLEGGVLRKEDEEKYKDILPTIGDVASVVKSKLDGLESAIRRKKDNELNSLEDAGYDVSRFRARSTTSAAPPAPPGWKYVPKPGGGWTAVEDK